MSPARRKKVKPKIMLVDDHNETLDLLELFLFDDYVVVTALNGFEGITTARKEAPDCIITDIMMPVMDGIRFFNELKKVDPLSTIPVVAITSFGSEQNVRSLINMGFSGIVPKPFKREAILKTLKAALS